VATIREAGSEGGVGVAAVKKKTNDVGAKNTAAALVGDLHKLLLLSVVADLRETRGDDDVALDLLGGSLASARNDKLGRDGVNGKIDLLIRDLSDLLVSLDATDLRGSGVDWVNLTLVLAVDEVLDNSVADAADLGGSTNDSNALGAEDLIHLI